MLANDGAGPFKTSRRLSTRLASGRFLESSGFGKYIQWWAFEANQTGGYSYPCHQKKMEMDRTCAAAGQYNIARIAMRWTPEGKRSRGRPNTTWRRTVEKVLRELNYSWSAIEKLAKDRQRWKDFVATLCATQAWWVVSKYRTLRFLWTVMSC